MLITSSILSIPPYISTSWKNIASLHVEMHISHPILIVILSTGAHINIPHLDPASMEAIFAMHAKHIESEHDIAPLKAPPKKPANNSPTQNSLPASFHFPLETPFNFPLNLDNMGISLQHTPEQAHAPDLPKELIDKITTLAKTIGISDPNMIPQPEPHCNCTYCQISRALHAGFVEQQEPNKLTNTEEEIVSEEDLKFRTWDINQKGDKLFIVQNPLDSKEHYSVYLGEPIGCTCGQKHCEHVRAVLNS